MTLRYLSIPLLLCAIGGSPIFAQAVFESNTASGDWNVVGCWALIGGSDSDGIPDSDDDVTILAGDLINVEPTGTVSVDDISITGVLHYLGNDRTLSVSGEHVTLEIPASFTNSSLSLKLLDSSGSIVNSMIIAENRVLTLDLGGLSKGLYSIQLTNGVQKVSQKF